MSYIAKKLPDLLISQSLDHLLKIFNDPDESYRMIFVIRVQYVSLVCFHTAPETCGPSLPRRQTSIQKLLTYLHTCERVEKEKGEQIFHHVPFDVVQFTDLCTQHARKHEEVH